MKEPDRTKIADLFRVMKHFIPGAEPNSFLVNQNLPELSRDEVLKRIGEASTEILLFINQYEAARQYLEHILALRNQIIDIFENIETNVPETRIKAVLAKARETKPELFDRQKNPVVKKNGESESHH